MTNCGNNNVNLNNFLKECKELKDINIWCKSSTTIIKFANNDFGLKFHH